MSAVSELKSFESACYCDLVHTTCTYCDAVAMDKMTTKRLYGAKTKRRTYTVTDEVHAELRRLGQGNASAGIREAVRLSEVKPSQ